MLRGDLDVNTFWEGETAGEEARQISAVGSCKQPAALFCMAWLDRLLQASSLQAGSPGAQQNMQLIKAGHTARL